MQRRHDSTTDSWQQRGSDAADVRFLIFAKAPVAGLAKTRLVSVLGADGAAHLQAAMTEHTLRTCLRVAPRRVELWCAPSATHPFFVACERRFGVPLREQPEGDLGQRMFHGLSDGLLQAPGAVLVGTDAPTLRAGDLKAAAAMLRAGTDAVLAPAVDGGYVLIGASRVEAGLFDEVEWGTPRVLEQTRRRLRALNYRWRELRAHRDIDTPADWAWLLKRAPAWAKRLKGPPPPESCEAPAPPTCCD